MPVSLFLETGITLDLLDRLNHSPREPPILIDYCLIILIVCNTVLPVTNLQI